MANEDIGDSQLVWTVWSPSAFPLTGTFLDRKKFLAPGLVSRPGGVRGRWSPVKGRSGGDARTCKCVLPPCPCRMNSEITRLGRERSTVASPAVRAQVRLGAVSVTYLPDGFGVFDRAVSFPPVSRPTGRGMATASTPMAGL